MTADVATGDERISPAQIEAAIGAAFQYDPVPSISPALAVEVVEGNTAQLELHCSRSIAIDLNVHHHVPRLLDLSNTSEFNPVRESGAQVVSCGVGAQVSG